MSRRILLYRTIVLVLLLSITLMSGCARKSSEPNLDIPPVASGIESHDDIVLPADMKLVSADSMAIRTDSFNGGIYHYRGRVDLNSLKEFITVSMANNKWKLVGEATYKHTMLAFIKPNKTCMITLAEGIGGFIGNTHVDLYVTSDLAAAKGLNPFGEPVN